MERALALLICLALSGCLQGDDCRSDADCAAGLVCVDRGLKVCVASGGTGGDGGGGAGGSAGSGGTGGGAGSGGSAGAAGSGGAGGGTAGTGGTGGTGGAGGIGGTGGIGGNGGTGGTGGEDPGETTSRIAFAAAMDGALASFLDAHTRAIRQLVLRLEGSSDVPGQLSFDLEAGELPRAGDGAGVVLEVPVDAAPGTTATLIIELRAAADRLGALEPDVVAVARVEVEVTSAAEPEPMALVLDALAPAFDYDGDGAADGVDCAPENPARYPGAVDVCDGEDRDCAPGSCVLPLPPDFVSVRDVSCEAEGCVAAVAGANAGAGALLLYEPTLDSAQPQTLLDGIDPLGVGVVPGADRVLFTESGSPYLSIANGPSWQADRRLLPLPPGRELITSPFGNIGFVASASLPAVVVLNPNNVSTFGSCNQQGTDCFAIEMETLLGEASSGGSMAPRALAVRHTASSFLASLYVAVSSEPSIILVTVDPISRTFVPERSGSAVLTSIPPRALALAPDGDHLYVAGGASAQDAEAAVVPSTGTPADHQPTPFPLPAGVCPSALRASASRLWVADDCQGAVWELPIGPGAVPDAAAAIRHDLPGCGSPFRLASPVAGALVVACDGASHLVVVGKD